MPSPIVRPFLGDRNVEKISPLVVGCMRLRRKGNANPLQFLIAPRIVSSQVGVASCYRTPDRRVSPVARNSLHTIQVSPHPISVLSFWRRHDTRSCYLSIAACLLRKLSTRSRCSFPSARQVSLRRICRISPETSQRYKRRH